MPVGLLRVLPRQPGVLAGSIKGDVIA